MPVCEVCAWAYVFIGCDLCQTKMFQVHSIYYFMMPWHHGKYLRAHRYIVQSTSLICFIFCPAFSLLVRRYFYFHFRPRFGYVIIIIIAIAIAKAIAIIFFVGNVGVLKAYVHMSRTRICSFVFGKSTMPGNKQWRTHTHTLKNICSWCWSLFYTFSLYLFSVFCVSGAWLLEVQKAKSLNNTYVIFHLRQSTTRVHKKMAVALSQRHAYIRNGRRKRNAKTTSTASLIHQVLPSILAGGFSFCFVPNKMLLCRSLYVFSLDFFAHYFAIKLVRNALHSISMNELSRYRSVAK